MDIYKVERIKLNVKGLIADLPVNVRLIAVTKNTNVEEIKIAVNAGIREIGENRVQEALDKYPFLSYLPIKWHLIGHLQTNKAKKAVQIFDLIHSVDSFKLAESIDRHAKEFNKIQDILIQVNIAEEKTKFGLNKKDVYTMVKNISTLNNVKIKGLMTIAPNVDDKNFIKGTFKELRELKDELAGLDKNIEILSMGMSDDYMLALKEGTNMVRIGRKIFA